MLFNSLTFLIFFAIVIALHHLPLSWRTKKFNLLIASYLFYAAWNPPFVVLIWISTLVDWFAARRMQAANARHTRRLFLLLSLTSNLGLLAYFKYGAFIAENFAALVRSAGIPYELAPPDIILPVGISFYTFQTLSYTIDVYRGSARPWNSFLDFALFVTFFPQLVAGPIVRAVDFLPQCIEPRRASARQLSWGLTLLLIGLFEKTVVADSLMAPISDRAFDATTALSFLSAWTGTLAFSIQIFCDFAGYSTCAIGTALCLGFSLPDNFHFPYASIGFSDFWRRWHISLSTWLRDYLYISLGGNRVGSVHTYANLMITMLLGGLWHGASWNFVIWGGLHGLYLVVERLLKEVLPKARFLESLVARLALALATYALVCVTWVFFRAQTLTASIGIVKSMVGLTAEGARSVIGSRDTALVVMTAGLTVALHWVLRDTTVEEASQRLPWWSRAILLAGLIIFVNLYVYGGDRAFIYFQF